MVFTLEEQALRMVRDAMKQRFIAIDQKLAALQSARAERMLEEQRVLQEIELDERSAQIRNTGLSPTVHTRMLEGHAPHDVVTAHERHGDSK
jgi:hypothetical protein